MELKLRPALMSLLALSSAATTANAATGVEGKDDPVTPVESAEWAANSSAPVDPAANLIFLEEGVELLSASEVTVFLLDAGHELRDRTVTVVAVGVADEKVEME